MQRLGVLVLAVLSGACGQLNGATGGGGGGGGSTDGGGATCPPERRVCTGDPDKGTLVCKCSGVFECPSPKKCETPKPLPPGGGEWTCAWTEFKYTCLSQGGSQPAGGGAWSCVPQGVGWSCTSTPLVPEGGGHWSCLVEGELLVCEESPTGGLAWGCAPQGGKQVCTVDDLPPGGGTWSCSQALVGGVATWVCVGTSPTPPGGGGWSCGPFGSGQGAWKCSKPVEQPPGGGTWQCVQGSEFGGTRCEEAPKKTGQACLIGEKMWCDGETYCGWGQVECDPKTNTWRTHLDASGKQVLDCKELSDGRRPNTLCACYHFYFDPVCCERPDCLLPAGGTGQLCPPSKGQTCDYCAPKQSECQGAARCVISNSHETYCAPLCGAGKTCPAGFLCVPFKEGGVSTFVCTPADASCFF